MSKLNQVFFNEYSKLDKLCRELYHKLPDDEIMRILESKGDVTVHNMKYRAFCAGKSDREDNEERLFLCRVRR